MRNFFNASSNSCLGSWSRPSSSIRRQCENRPVRVATARRRTNDLACFCTCSSCTTRSNSSESVGTCRSSTSETLSLSTAQARVDFGSPGWSSVAIKGAVQSKEESRELPDGVLVAAGSDYSNCESNSIAQQLLSSRIGCSNFRMMQMTDAASRHAGHVLQGLRNSSAASMQGSRPGSATAGKENERSPLLLPILGLNSGERASHFAYDGPQAFQNPDGPSPTHQLEAVAAKMSSLELSTSPMQLPAQTASSTSQHLAVLTATLTVRSIECSAAQMLAVRMELRESSVRQRRMPVSESGNLAKMAHMRRCKLKTSTLATASAFSPDRHPGSGRLRPSTAGRDAAGSLKCRISRHSRGMDGSRYPTYYLHLERDDGKRSFLLAARKRKRSSTSNYLISCDPTDLSRRGDGYVGKLRANFLGTAFTVFDSGLSPKKLTGGQVAGGWRELAGITYETNVLGFRGPRKMTVVLPAMLEAEEGDCVRVDIRSNSEEEGLVERLKRREMSHLMELHNRT
uniref:Tub domain-containing protein n=1 Tax=Macrostomum lignano TaxID=282301 RepID=A0A1I8IW87_9PLAT